MRLSVIKRKIEGKQNWTLAYIDLLTILVCFFVIFYNLNDDVGNTDNINSLSTLKLSLLKKYNETNSGIAQGNLENTKTGLGSKTGNGKSSLNTAAKKSVAFITLTELLMKNNFKSKIEQTEGDLAIGFANDHIFPSGGFELNSLGVNQVHLLIKELLPYKDQLNITVQGHTDKVKFKAPQAGRTINDNWELSVFRATKVLKEFIKQGFSPNNLSAEGFADNIESLHKNYLRRVTVRVSLKKEHARVIK